MVDLHAQRLGRGGRELSAEQDWHPHQDQRDQNTRSCRAGVNLVSVPITTGRIKPASCLDERCRKKEGLTYFKIFTEVAVGK